MARLEELITWPSIREVCQLTGVHQNSAYAWARQGKVEAVQLCGRWRFSPKDVERLQQQRAAKRAKKEHRNGNE